MSGNPGIAAILAALSQQQGQLQGAPQPQLEQAPDPGAVATAKSLAAQTNAPPPAPLSAAALNAAAGNTGAGAVSQVPQMPAPTMPPVVQSKSGPVKSFLSEFLYGGGQAMLQHVGLPTDYDKQQAAQQQALQAQAANDRSRLVGMQLDSLRQKADEFDRQSQPFHVSG